MTNEVRFVCNECAQDSHNWGAVPNFVAAEDYDRLADEADALRARVAELEAGLKRVSDFDPDGTRPCEIAREVLRLSGSDTGTRNG